MSARDHIVDSIPLGGIVSVRDRLLEMQAKRASRSSGWSRAIPRSTSRRTCARRSRGRCATARPTTPPAPASRRCAGRSPTSCGAITASRSRDPERVLVTNGAMNGLYIAFRALVERPGDEVIIPDPTWTETADNVRLAGGVAWCAVPLDPRAAKPGARADRRSGVAAHAGDRAQHTAQPHRRGARPATLEAILAVAERHDLWVVADEAYEHVLFDGREHLSSARCPRLRPGAQHLLDVQVVRDERAARRLPRGNDDLHDRAHGQAPALHDQRRQLGDAARRRGRARRPAGVHVARWPRDLPAAARPPDGGAAPPHPPRGVRAAGRLLPLGADRRLLARARGPPRRLGDDAVADREGRHRQRAGRGLRAAPATATCASPSPAPPSRSSAPPWRSGSCWDSRFAP